MARVYATSEELSAWTGQPAPPDVERLLARASEDVDDVLLAAVYATDAAGMPTDPADRQALADATCAQVEYQLAADDDGTGATGRYDTVRIGSVELSGRLDTAPAAGTLGPRAYRALRRAGLLPGVIW